MVIFEYIDRLLGNAREEKNHHDWVTCKILEHEERNLFSQNYEVLDILFGWEVMLVYHECINLNNFRSVSLGVDFDQEKRTWL